VFIKKIRKEKKFLIQISDLRQSRPLRGAFLIPPALPEVADLPFMVPRDRIELPTRGFSVAFL